MGLQSGTLALRKHRILGPLGSWESIRQQLCAHSQKPIGLEEATEESFGWCHPFSGEPYGPGTEDAQWDDAWVLGVRWDTKRVPVTYLRLELQQALAQLPPKIQQNPKARDQLKEDLKHQLLSRSLPSVRLVECLLYIDRMEFWVLNTSEKTLGTIQHLFRETFQVDLLELTPGTSHLPWGQKELEESVETTLDTMPLGLDWGKFRDLSSTLRSGAQSLPGSSEGQKPTSSNSPNPGPAPF